MPARSSVNTGTDRTAHEGPSPEGTAGADHEDVIGSAARGAHMTLSQLGMNGVLLGKVDAVKNAATDELQRDRRHTISSLTAAVLGALVAMVKDPQHR